MLQLTNLKTRYSERFYNTSYLGPDFLGLLGGKGLDVGTVH